MSAAVITGMSVITPLADSVPALAQALAAGEKRFVASEVEGVSVSRIEGFDPTRYCNVRGMRVYPRASQLEICAAKLALADAGLPDTALDPLQLGLVTASGASHMDTLLEYDRGLFTIGMQRTNPTLMPLGLPSAPGAATALAINAKAFSITLTDGGATGLAALALGSRLVADGRAQVCVVAGALAWCKDLALAALRAGVLTDSEHHALLGAESRGALYGEAAAALVIEQASRAAARERKPHGRVLGHAATFALEAAQHEVALTRAARTALHNASLAPDRIALVASGASGVVDTDRAQQRAVSSVLGAHATRAEQRAIKENLGESLDTSGLLQSIAALAALPAGGMALAIDVSPTGSCEALVLGAG